MYACSEISLNGRRNEFKRRFTTLVAMVWNGGYPRSAGTICWPYRVPCFSFVNHSFSLPIGPASHLGSRKVGSLVSAPTQRHLMSLQPPTRNWLGVTVPTCCLLATHCIVSSRCIVSTGCTVSTRSVVIKFALHVNAIPPPLMPWCCIPESIGVPPTPALSSSFMARFSMRFQRFHNALTMSPSIVSSSSCGGQRPCTMMPGPLLSTPRISFGTSGAVNYRRVVAPLQIAIMHRTDSDAWKLVQPQ